MTNIEYTKELKQLEEKYNLNKSKLAIKFSNENNPYKVGDTISDHIGTGRVVSWKTHIGFYPNIPCLMYFCDNLTKQGTINKREPKRYIYQSNIEV